MHNVSKILKIGGGVSWSCFFVVRGLCFCGCLRVWSRLKSDHLTGRLANLLSETMLANDNEGEMN